MVEDIDAILDKLDELAEKIDDIGVKIDEMSEKGIKIEVEIIGQDKLDELKLFLDDIADHEYIVNLRIEIDGEDKVDELKLKLDELEAAPHEIDLKVNDADLADAEAKIAALNHQLDNNKNSMDAAKDSGNGFEFSMLMLAPALIPVSAALVSVVGAAGGLAAAFGAMAVPGLAFGLSLKSMYTSASTLVSSLTAAQQASLASANTFGQVTSILNKSSTAYQNMDSYMRNVTTEYVLMKNAVTKFQDALQPEAAVAMYDGMQLLDVALKDLLPAAQQFGKAFDGVLGTLLSRMQDPVFQSFFANATKWMGALVTSWGDGFINIIEGITALLDAFLPLGVSMSSGFLKMTQSFDAWAQKIGNTAGWKKFISTVETDGPKILKTLGDIVRVITHIVTALGEQNVNTKIFDDLVGVFGKLSNLTGAHQGLTAIIGDVLLLGIAAVKLGPALGPLMSFLASPVGIVVGSIIALGAAFLYAYEKSKTFHDWVNANFGPMFKSLEGDVQQFKQWFTSVWPEIQQVWQKYGKNIENIIVDDFGFIVSTIGNALKVIEGVIDIALGLLTGNWSKVWTGIKMILGGIWNEIVATAEDGAKILGNELDMAWKTISADVSSAWDKIYANFVKNMGDIESATKGGFDTVTRDAEQWGKDFYNAIVSAINTVLNFFGTLDTKIVNAIGDAGKILWNIGVDIIDGLIGGIESMIGDVESTLSSLTSWITSWKGPPEKDKSLLTPAGASIIQGLIDGMESKYGGVENSLGGLTKTIGSKFGQQFTTDINAQVNASLNAVGNNRQMSGAAGGSGSGGVNVNSGAIQINNPTAEPASVSLTKLLQNGAKFGMLQAPIGTPTGV
jgi:phage-related protein